MKTPLWLLAHKKEAGGLRSTKFKQMRWSQEAYIGYTHTLMIPRYIFQSVHPKYFRKSFQVQL